MRKIALGLTAALLIAGVAAATYRLTKGPSQVRLSTADATAAMRAGSLQEIGLESTLGEKGPLGTECRAQVHGVTRGNPDRDYQVSMWVCGSAAQAHGIADDFPASMPGLSAVPAGLGDRPGINVSAQDNVLVWVAASRPAVAYQAAEHLRDLLGERAS